jgi:hypothetical protein
VEKEQDSMWAPRQVRLRLRTARAVPRRTFTANLKDGLHLPRVDALAQARRQLGLGLGC